MRFNAAENIDTLLQFIIIQLFIKSKIIIKYI